MPNIHGALLHVPKPPPAGKFKQASDAIKGSKGYQRAQRKFQTATGNATSKPGWRTGKGGREKHGKFGTTTPADRELRTEQRLASGHAAAYGLGLGVGTGALAGGNLSGRNQQIQRNKASINRNKKKLGVVGKRVHLITDVGTAAGRASRKIDLGTHPWKPGVAAMTLGAGTTGTLAVSARKKQSQELKRQKGVLVEQRSQLRQVKKSAFGVEH
jgi:hypothetical protein